MQWCIVLFYIYLQYYFAYICKYILHVFANIFCTYLQIYLLWASKCCDSKQSTVFSSHSADAALLLMFIWGLHCIRGEYFSQKTYLTADCWSLFEGTAVFISVQKCSKVFNSVEAYLRAPLSGASLVETVALGQQWRNAASLKCCKWIHYRRAWCTCDYCTVYIIRVQFTSVGASLHVDALHWYMA